MLSSVVFRPGLGGTLPWLGSLRYGVRPECPELHFRSLRIFNVAETVERTAMDMVCTHNDNNNHMQMSIMALHSLQYERLVVSFNNTRYFVKPV